MELILNSIPCCCLILERAGDAYHQGASTVESYFSSVQW